MDTLSITRGMVISGSAIIIQNNYSFEPGGKDIIVIRGNNITVDFSHSKISATPNSGRSTGAAVIRVANGSKHVIIKNLSVEGFGQVVVANETDDLTLVQLTATAGGTEVPPFVFTNSRKISFNNNRISKSAGALVLQNCQQSVVSDNDLFLNTGTVILLKGGKDNKVYHNRIDWNAAKSGLQETCGLTLCEQSNHNIIAYNSITHNTRALLITGNRKPYKEGSDDNLIYGNDLSFSEDAITMEGSSNLIMKNVITNSNSGIKLMNCFDSDITDNNISTNTTGINIVSSRSSNIAMNRFIADSTGIRFKVSDLHSINFWIAGNRFEDTKLVYDLHALDSVAFSGNARQPAWAATAIADDVTAADSSREADPLDLDYQPDSRLKSIPATSAPDPLPRPSQETGLSKFAPERSSRSEATDPARSRQSDFLVMLSSAVTFFRDHSFHNRLNHQDQYSARNISPVSTSIF